MRRFAALLVAMMACSDDDANPQPTIDGGQDASVDASRDATGVPLDAGTSCQSPLAFDRASTKACACIRTPVTSGEGYCVGGGDAVFCGPDSKWKGAKDGPCFPTRAPFPVGSCALLQGTEISGTECPSGFARRNPYTGSSDAGLGETATCCYPIQVPRSNCESAGHRIETVDSGAPSLDRRCGQGTLKAFVIGDAAGLCCD